MEKEKNIFPQAKKTPIFTNKTPINGRKQIVDLLRAMPLGEKKKLLKNMALKNPQLVQEMMQEGVSFEQLEYLTEEQLSTLFNYIDANTMGMALKNSPNTLQKYFLRKAPKNYAENAYVVMMTATNEETKKVELAKDKVMNMAAQLFGQNFAPIVL